MQNTPKTQGKRVHLSFTFAHFFLTMQRARYSQPPRKILCRCIYISMLPIFVCLSMSQLNHFHLSFRTFHSKQLNHNLAHFRCNSHSTTTPYNSHTHTHTHKECSSDREQLFSHPSINAADKPILHSARTRIPL